MVLPALVTGQLLVMRGKFRRKDETPTDELEKSVPPADLPMGLAIWASVSETVSEKLAQQKADKASYRLAPHEWKSGDKPWLLAMVGPEPVAKALTAHLSDKVFQGKDIERHVMAEAVKRAE